MNEMKKPIPWGRGIAAVLAVAAFATGAYFGWEWWTFRASCADASTAEIAVLPDAFGTKGTFQADFSPKFGFAHNQALVVEDGPPIRTRDGVQAMVEGLRADLVILDQAGNPVVEVPIAGDSFNPFWMGANANSFQPALVFHPVPPGHYQLRLTVHEPAPALVGVRHRVVGRYSLCGLERLVTAITGGIALAALLLSLAIAAGIVAVTRHKRRL